jgi:hypothetical protein
MNITNLLALTFAVLLSSCSSEPETVEAAVKLTACKVVDYSKARNIFNSQSAACEDDSRVYWFPTAEANANHAQVCAGFGGKKIAGGKTWSQYKPSC